MSKILEYFKGDELAASVWKNKYQANDETIEEFFDRIISEFSRKEYERNQNINRDNIDSLSDYGKRRLNTAVVIGESISKYIKDFKYIIPGGSALSGIGSERPVSLSNCFVIQSPEDTIESIFNTSRDMAQIYKRRGGVGLDLSYLRPDGSDVNNAARTSSGVPSWMELYSKVTEVICQGGRRGALMLSIDINHPDSPNFTRIKQDLSKVTGANVSVKINDAFMKAVENDEDYILKYPCDLNLDDYSTDYLDVDYNQLAYIENHMCDNQICYIKKIKAKELWEEIIKCAHNTGEPGILNWERTLNYDPTSVYPQLRAISTNPCGELPLGAYDSCRLIASNLYSLVDNPFTLDANLNEELAYEVFYETQVLADLFVDLELEAVERILTKINPNWIEEQGDGDWEIWLHEQSDEFKLWWKIYHIGSRGRRTGTGITAYGDMLAALGLEYGNKEITETIFRLKLQAELDASIDMAILYGAFPLWDKNKECPEFKPDLRMDANEWYKFISEMYPEQSARMLKFGRRNAGISTIAPTGTISMLTQTTSGIEPVFSLYYTRRRKCNPGEEADFTDQNGVEFVEYNVVHPKLQEWVNKGTIGEICDLALISKDELDEYVKRSPWFGQTANDLNAETRVETQALIQKYITSSISSTVNLPNDVSEETINTIYKSAFSKGCKGITVYRDGSRSGVLVNDSKPQQSEEIERPEILDCKILHFKNDRKDWVAFVGILDGKPYEIFTGIRDIETFPIPTSVVAGKIIRVKFDPEQHARYDLVYQDSYGFENRLGGLSRIFNKEYWNYARFVSALLRSKSNDISEVIRVVEGLEFENKSLNNWQSGVIRALKEYIPDGTVVRGAECPECGGTIIYQGGCHICTTCGHSKCL